MFRSHPAREQGITGEARHRSPIAAQLLALLLGALTGCGGRVIGDEATIGGATTNGGTGGTPVSGGGEGGAGASAPTAAAGMSGSAGASGAAASDGGSVTGGATTNGGTGGTPTGGTGATSTGGTGAITYGIPGQSCTGLTGTECSGESCCTSILVPGGTFMMGRSEDGTDAYDGGYSDEQPEHSVTVDTFYLDKYEVTVGRFRAFVEQYDGTPPPVGAGAHPSIAGTGWDSAWDDAMPATQAELMDHLHCSPGSETWTDTADTNETYAINCVNWYEAQAFCAWDGGRLPTEAEWEYAAAGGNENRLYPWGSAAPDASLANCYYGGNTLLLAVGSRPLGAGRWGQQDLAGGVWEWTFDWYDESWYSNASATEQDACNVTTATYRALHGGAWASLGDSYLRAACRSHLFPLHWSYGAGLRCARTP